MEYKSHMTLHVFVSYYMYHSFSCLKMVTLFCCVWNPSIMSDYSLSNLIWSYYYLDRFSIFSYYTFRIPCSQFLVCKTRMTRNTLLLVNLEFSFSIWLSIPPSILDAFPLCWRQQDSCHTAIPGVETSKS